MAAVVRAVPRLLETYEHPRGVFASFLQQLLPALLRGPEVKVEGKGAKRRHDAEHGRGHQHEDIQLTSLAALVHMVRTACLPHPSVSVSCAGCGLPRPGA